MSDQTRIRLTERHDVLTSTNDRAIELASDPKLVTPALIVAARQTVGRGRGRNRWWSGEGGLTFSLLVDVPPARVTSMLKTCLTSTSQAPRTLMPPRLSLATAVAVCEALEGVVGNLRFGIKWPNDVVDVESLRKVSGVLIEIPAAPVAQPRRVVIGIGVNVNNSFTTAPLEIRQRGVALCDLCGGPCDAEELLQAMAIAVIERAELAFGDSSEPARQWSKRSVLNGRRISLTDGDRVWTGTCDGVDEAGALLLATQPDGHMSFLRGTVRLV